MKSRTIIYYTNNILDGTRLNEEVKRRLLDTGIDIISVSLKPIDFGHNFTIDGESGYTSYYRQILLGLMVANTEMIFLCEHDVLYNNTHFDIETDTITYNNNMWRCSDLGYYRLDRWICMSMLAGNRIFTIEQMKIKYKAYLDGVKLSMLEPGYGLPEPNFTPEEYYSKEPCIDIRHEKCFTGCFRGSTRNTQRALLNFGSYKVLRKKLGL